MNSKSYSSKNLKYSIELSKSISIFFNTSSNTLIGINLYFQNTTFYNKSKSFKQNLLWEYTTTNYFTITTIIIATTIFIFYPLTC